jgi:hypothetical protein
LEPSFFRLRSKADGFVLSEECSNDGAYRVFRLRLICFFDDLNQFIFRGDLLQIIIGFIAWKAT